MRLKAGSALAAVALLAPAAALAQSDTAGKSTVQQSIVGGDRSAGFATLSIGPGKPYVIREEIVKAPAGREARRRSLAYFGQLTDFQLADEESPARVEFLDAPGTRPRPRGGPRRRWPRRRSTRRSTR